VIPAYNHSHVLPPFVGVDPTVRQGVSPYETTLSDLVDRFSTSPERAAILWGLLDYRAILNPLGIVSGYQWLSGSFTENIEALQARPPGDVDVVTVAHRPCLCGTVAPASSPIPPLKTDPAFAAPLPTVAVRTRR
jgi:hypothetical protein